MRIKGITTLIITAICCVTFLVSLLQMEHIASTEGTSALAYELAPIQQELLFDIPPYLYHTQGNNDLRPHTPSWEGVVPLLAQGGWRALRGPLPQDFFGKIREGQGWRLFTPALLHGGWLHLLFNMAWLISLGKQVEERIGIGKYLVLSLVLGITANVTQYLASGPIFLGYSGIIAGLVGFIWMRQRKFPWEGYPLPKSTILFITAFIALMLGIQIVCFILKTPFPIANSAHLAGASLGLILGRLSYFSRKVL